MQIINVRDIVEANGKTVRKNNLEKPHVIPVGALVELVGGEYAYPWVGLRLLVCYQGRDCDGEPLYWCGTDRELAWYSNQDRDETYKLFYPLSGGFGEESLVVIQAPGQLKGEKG